jgi:hypothetical protein
LDLRTSGGWRKVFYNDELHNLCSPLNIIRMIKSRWMRTEEHIARMGTGRIAYKVSVKIPEGKGSVRRPRNKWEYNIKRTLNKQDGRAWTGFILRLLGFETLSFV